MYKYRFIRNFAAGIMLLLFAISITPKQLLHDAITGHNHGYEMRSGITSFVNSSKSFQCNWENDQVESPFTPGQGIQLEQPLLLYSLYFDHYTSAHYSAEHHLYSLRGPPSQV